MRIPRRAAVVAVLLSVAACGGTPASAPPSAPAAGGSTSNSSPPATSSAAPTVHVGHSAWVAVSVATLWRSPSSVRSVDARALRAPADVRGWLAAMSLAQRRALVGRADTQALLGDRVLVVGMRGTWSHVVVPSQRTPLDTRGYPGWLPTRQLGARAPVTTTRVATVLARTTWLRTDSTTLARVAELSYGTALPVLGTRGTWVRVSLPGGRVGRLAAAAVGVHARGLPALAPSGASLVRAAQAFTGLPYLWAGRSGFGFDCSGLTSLVHQVHGVGIPRDADAQARVGRAVSTSHLRAGDLLFFATSSGFVHHVSMYAGGGRMVQSPATGRTVETIPVSTPAYARQLSGARRNLP